MSEYKLLTVEEVGGELAIKRRDPAEAVPAASQVHRAASGDPAEFSDGVFGQSFRALAAEILPMQAGSGDPSPTNIRAISGWTGALFTRTGVNMMGGARLAERVQASMPSAVIDTEAGTVAFARNAATAERILSASERSFPFKENTRYTFIMTGKGTADGKSNLRVMYTDGTYNGIPSFGDGTANVKSTVVLVTAEGKTVAYFGKVQNSGTTTLYYDECAILEGVHTADDFVPYEGAAEEADWSSVGTIYGGDADALGGKVHSGAVLKTFTGTESWSKLGSGDSVYYRVRLTTDLTLYKTMDSKTLCSHFTGAVISSSTTDVGFYAYNTTPGTTASGYYICIRPGVESVTDLDSFKAWLAEQNTAETPVQVLYWRVTPNEYDIDPISMTSLGGENRVWADCGPVSLEYAADTQTYIDDGDAADRAMIADEAPGFIAGRNFVIGEFLTVGDTLYKVTANIASGGTVSPGVNVTATTVGEEMAELGGNAVTLDTALTTSGAAADAKAAGDAVSEVKAGARAGGYVLPQPTTMEAISWDVGGFDDATGEENLSGTYLHTVSFVWPGTGLYGAKADYDYAFTVYAWAKTGGAYVGRWTTGNAFSKTGTTQFVASFDFTPYPDYKFKIVLERTNPAGSITLSESAKCSFTAHAWMVNERKILGDIAPMVYGSNGSYVTDRAFSAGALMTTEDGKLLRATQSIEAEYSVTVGVNAAETTIAEQLAALWAAVNS